MLMTRPHPISLGLIALIFSFFNNGPLLPILISSFLLSWFHSSFFWFPIATITPIIIFKWLNKEKIGITKISGLLISVAGGLMARPHPIENLKLIYSQIIDVYLLKGYELAALIGAELRMSVVTSWISFAKLFWPIILMVVVPLIILVRAAYKKWDFAKETKIIVISSFIMLFFSINMYITSNRAIDLLSLFSVIFAGSVISYYLSREEELNPRLLF